MSDHHAHPVPSVLAAYHTRGLTPSEVLAVSDHLAGCADCREALGRLSGRERIPQMEVFRLEAVDGLPTYAEMAACLDEELDAVQSADLQRRLEAEPSLAAEFADLKAFRREMAALPPRLHGPVAARQDQAAGDETSARSPIIPFPRRWWTPLAAAAVLLAFAGWWLLSTTRESHSPSLLAAVDGRHADLGQLPADLRGGIEEAARTGGLAFPTLPPILRPAAGTLAGQAPEAIFLQISPVGEVVRTTNPNFRWTPCAGAETYVIYLVPTDAPDAVRFQELPGTQSEWTPSAPLSRGTVYEWQVEAKTHDGKIIDRAPKPPAGEARFQILAATAADELDGVKKRFGSYPLVLGTAYARAGLRREAATQFHELARQHPESEVAKHLELTAAQH